MGNSTFQIKTSYISLPSFLNPLRGSIYITWFFQKGSPVPTITTPFLTAPFIRTLGLDKRRCFYFGDRPWASIVHFKLLWCFKLLLVSKLRVWCLAMVTVLDIPNEGDWWVRDCLLPSFSKKGSTWLQVILFSYGLFPTESEWGVGSIHSMKSTAGFSFYHSPDILE